MFKKIFLMLLTVVVGMSIGGAILFLSGKFPLPYNHPLYTAFGISKPQIIGFQPYWLLDKAREDYSSQITTLTYFGIGIDSDGKLLKLTNPREEEPGWTTLRTDKFLKRAQTAQKHNLKLSLLVNTFDNDVITALINEPQVSAQNLVNEVAPIMREHGFTDLNLDIENFNQASESSRLQFTEFVREIKNELVNQNLGTLTIEVTPISLVKKHLIDASKIGEIADSIVLMAYDYHYSGSYNAGPVAPINGVGETLEYDVETAVKEAIKVIPKEKIILGIPLYGYEWETIRETQGSATIPGSAATASNARISELLKSCQNCTQTFDPISQEPIIVFPDASHFHQIYYENAQAFEQKVKLAEKYQLGGVAMWALGYEDSQLLSPLVSYKHVFWFK